MGIFSWLVDKRIAVYQNNLIEKHYAEVENIYRQIRGWQHDYHNHIQAMKGLAYGLSGELDAYLNNLDADLTQVDTMLKTGNIMVDAILNSKLSLAQSRDIDISAKAYVPTSLHVSEVDLCVVLGNLLDNSMDACEKITDESKRFIRLYIDTMKEQLYISVSNASTGELKKYGKSYQTTKGFSHGFGLLSVDRIVRKYDGYVNRQHEEGIFATEIMLPL